MKKKTNDTISCPNVVEEIVENCLLPTLPMHTISEIDYHTLFLSLAWAQQEDCHFLLKEPEICDNFITHSLIFPPQKYFTPCIFPYCDFEKKFVPRWWLFDRPTITLNY